MPSTNPFNASIVILDGHALNPGDLSWSALEALGPLVCYPRTRAEDIVSRSAPADVLLTNKTPLSASTLAELPRLRYIGVLATGHNVVDSAAARARGIPVTNVPGYATNAVAQHTVALLLELTNHAGHHADTVQAGRWSSSPDFCYWDHPLLELAGLRLGIIGGGRIGSAVACIAGGFGMSVAIATRSGGRAELEKVIRTSDVISLHCPLTPDTRELINAETIAWMKPAALLLNTSRGALVNEADLAAALNSGRIAGAGLDVLPTEPPLAGSPLLSARNCIVTPHMAWATREARASLVGIAAGNIRSFLAGKPVNVVN
jgi:glycerate dehydrogenase